jgi:hypothetical protein
VLLQLCELRSQPSVVGPLGETSVSTERIGGPIFNIYIIIILKSAISQTTIYIKQSIRHHQQAQTSNPFIQANEV